jgi:phosphoribosylformimino-5-aminoimidazole carboxamide ribotide isomerase
MKILPVLDVMNGQVVRGVAGRRHEYRPIVSKLTQSTDPCHIAVAFRDHFGFEEIYLADLDAIAGKPAALGLYDDLQRRGFRLWVDAGLRTGDDAVPLLAQGVGSIVAGLETLAGPAVLAELLERVSPGRLVFSLDLKAGQPLGDLSKWPARDGAGLAETALALGIRRLLVLDLTRVGLGAGVGTELLCAALRRRHPELEITTGGGVRNDEDLEGLRLCGVNYALVASALHDGRIISPAAELNDTQSCPWIALQ